VADALRAGGAGRVICVGGDGGRLASLGLPGVADHHPGAGPLGGLLTALAVADAADGFDIVVVAACDQPRLDGPTVAALAGALSAAPPSVAAAVGTVAGVRQVLPVAARPGGAIGPLAEAFTQGARSLRDGLDALAVVDVECAAAPFADVDTPGDLRCASRDRPHR